MTTTLGSVVAGLASLVRCVGMAYIVVQIAIWHSFYAAAPWRLAAPALAVAWGTVVAASVRRRWPSVRLACADTAVYTALALSAQVCVPTAVRDDAFSWLVISMSGQILIPAWYVPGALSLPLAFISPAAYLAGAVLQPVTNSRTLIGATILLIVVGLVHTLGRRELHARASAVDAALDGADRAASEQYAILSGNIERREQERLLHDTVLNTLTALGRGGGDDGAGAVSRSRQDVALIENALGNPGDLTAGDMRPASDLLAAVRSVADDMRARGLDIHLEVEDWGAPAIPARVTTALANAAREALLNVAAHAGTGEAWVRVRLAAAEGEGRDPCLAQVIVRDQGRGFDLSRVDPARLGLRRSIAERAADYGGQASVWSEPGQGTVVCLTWPASPRPGGPDPAGSPLADGVLAQENALW